MDNRGITIVELVIVIAIMAILTGLSGISLSALDTARSQGAAISLNSRISNAKSRAKALQKTSMDEYYAVKLYRGTDGKLHMASGTIAGSTWTVDMVDGKADDVAVAKNVTLSYTGVDSSGYDETAKLINGTSTGNNTFYIYFNKRGQCISGAGTYSFIKRGKASSIAVVRPNGSHEYR